MIKDDNVAIRNLETIQMLTRSLGIKYVLVNDVSGPPGTSIVAQTDLANGAIFAKDIVHLVTSYLVRQASEVRMDGETRGGWA